MLLITEKLARDTTGRLQTEDRTAILAFGLIGGGVWGAADATDQTAGTEWIL